MKHGMARTVFFLILENSLQQEGGSFKNIVQFGIIEGCTSAMCNLIIISARNVSNGNTRLCYIFFPFPRRFCCGWVFILECFIIKTFSFCDLILFSNCHVVSWLLWFLSSIIKLYEKALQSTDKVILYWRKKNQAICHSSYTNFTAPHFFISTTSVLFVTITQ